MNPTAHRTLPGTDLSLSPIGMGCWAMGGLWWGDDVDDGQTTRAVHAALDAGINWFDTAPLYGHGHADEVLAAALKGRDGAHVLTKVGVVWDGDGQHAESRLTPEVIDADVDASLRRLGVETIDLLQVHWPCQSNTPIDETMAALDRAVQSGKVRYLGVCNYNAEGLAAIRATGVAIVSLQTPYSMLRREFESRLAAAVVDAEGEQDLGVFAYEPLCRGLLTGKFDALSTFPDSDLRARDDRFKGRRFLQALAIVGRLQWLARSLDVSVAALALAWVVRQPRITFAIAGAKTPEQVADHAAALALAARDDVPWDAVTKIVGDYRG
jgi:aryl-alcohol dehydrogenase-like predicted oxidoreductase